MQDLSFSALREANLARLPEFKNKHGAPAHAEPDGSDWSNDMWVAATLGELGEFANVYKKFVRGDIANDEFMWEGGKELADVVTYLDITAYRNGCEPFTALVKTFGELRMWNRDNKNGEGHTIAQLIRLSAGLISTPFSTTKTFELVFAYLDVIADKMFVDLGSMTQKKWNDVSLRVGSNTRLAGSRFYRVDSSER